MKGPGTMKIITTETITEKTGTIMIGMTEAAVMIIDGKIREAGKIFLSNQNPPSAGFLFFVTEKKTKEIITLNIEY